MATKFGWKVTYLDVLLPVKSSDPLLRGLVRSRDKMKVISPLPQCLWPLNLAGW